MKKVFSIQNLIPLFITNFGAKNICTTKNCDKKVTKFYSEKKISHKTKLAKFFAVNDLENIFKKLPPHELGRTYSFSNKKGACP
jgi:hypothetical protein